MRASRARIHPKRHRRSTYVDYVFQDGFACVSASKTRFGNNGSMNTSRHDALIYASGNVTSHVTSTGHTEIASYRDLRCGRVHARVVL